MRISGWLYGIQQCLCACSLFLAMGACAGVQRPALHRLLLASLAAGALATLTAASGHESLRLLALALTVFLPRMVWPRLPRTLRRQMALTLFALPMMMAGAARLTGSLGLHGPLTILPPAILAPLLARLTPRSTAAACIKADISRGENRISLTALVDSGNLLRDPLTQLPVIVVSRQAAERLIPLPPPGEIAPGMRLISVRTVAGTALMAVFRPNRVRLLLPGGWHDVSAMVGISPGHYDGFQALIPAGLTQTNDAPSQGG